MTPRTVTGRTSAARIEEGFREIGILVVAFTPIDAIFTPESDYRAQSVVLFLTYGILLFVLALVMEARRTRD
jgi:hypothetical protein